MEMGSDSDLDHPLWAVMLVRSPGSVNPLRASVHFLVQLLNVTSLEFSSPEHTEGHEALMALNRLFPKAALQVPFFFPSLFRSIPLVHYDRQVPGVVYFTSIDNQTSIEDPSFRLDEIQEQIHDTLISPSGVATMLEVVLVHTHPSVFEAIDMITNATNTALQLYGVEDKVAAGMTGQFIFWKDIRDGTAGDLLKMDAFCMPLALLVLALTLRSVRLLVIPILSVAMSQYSCLA
ncbi:hypothetical protein PAPYR_5518 [Paratrimastix pyriformis]|uniref:Membrane transport protein MMPL domain-containing protein n=1 Tax=Paratrimastix pyriformis TaxID=342808 RepID=A0ABQ8UMQ2_9EUKA|nr:hypothetical protein PAPYR_5518 [Paratrimastix pyriformis]